MGLSFGDLVTVIWFALDAGTHLTIEAAYLYLALGTTGFMSLILLLIFYHSTVNTLSCKV